MNQRPVRARSLQAVAALSFVAFIGGVAMLLAVSTSCVCSLCAEYIRAPVDEQPIQVHRLIHSRFKI